MVKSQSSDQPEAIAEAEQRRITPKKQLNTSPQNSLNDLLEDRLQVQSKVEGRRGSSSSSSSSCSSTLLGHPAPGGPPSLGSLDRWEHPGGSSGGSSRVAGASGPSLADTYHRCESPDISYSSFVKAYSGLSLVVPKSSDCLLPAELRVGSLPSDCSSEGSVSSDSFSPDPLLDDGPRCHYHHNYPHHHHHCSGQYPLPTSRAPPGLGQHTPRGFPGPQTLQRPHDFGLEDRPSSVPSHASHHIFKPPSAYIPSHSQQPLFSSFPGEFRTHPPHPPQTSTAQSYSQSSSLSHNMLGSLWQEGRLQDAQVYKGAPFNSSRNLSGLNQHQQHQVNWDPHYQQSNKPCYDLFASQSHPEIQKKAWQFSLGRQAHLSPRDLPESSLPPPPQLSLPPISAHKSQLPSVPQHQELPALGRYRDLRERVFVNLCHIFPPDLVRIVMTRNPNITDAQELAAMILIEKSQHSS